MRVAVGAIVHETNTFSPIPTPLSAFYEGRDALLTDAALIDALRDTKSEIGGFLEVGAAAGWEIVPTIAAHATPSGDVQAAAHDALKEALVGRLRSALPVDGVLLNLHGAMLAENAHDAEGDICRAVRAVVGPACPIVLSMDLHGNITPEMCAAVDAVFVYDTNPHIDAFERGAEAAACLARVLRGEIPRPIVAISKPPMLPPTINMRTGEGPMRALLAQARAWEARAGVVNVGLFPGFPYADFDQAGTAVVVTATDPELGQACADHLGRATWELRDEFLKHIPPVDAAVDQALRLVSQGGDGPVALADVADNPGGGGSGDTTLLLHELVARGARGAIAAVWDPETVDQAIGVGVGGQAIFHIGGKAAPDQYGPPVEVVGRVTHVSDGSFVAMGPVYRGMEVNCGPTACIDASGLKFIVTSIRHAANDRGFFQVAGVEPEREPLLVIKSRGHFRADFEPICRAIIEVDAPGAANPNLSRYSYRRVRRPIWPLDPDTTWSR